MAEQSVIPSMWRSISKRIRIQAGQGIKQDPISKITKQKGLAAWLKW
jgi:hypothetical protein